MRHIDHKEVKVRKEELIEKLVKDFKKNEGANAKPEMVEDLRNRLKLFTLHTLELLAKGL